MLAKFESLPDETPESDPRLRLMDSWAEYTGILRINPAPIHKALGEVMVRHLKRRGPDTTFAADIEAALTSADPQLVVALNGMRSALDRMHGWPIAWRHQRFGEVIGSDIYQDIDNDELVIQHLRRAPMEFDELSGVIVGNRIGADPVMMGLGTWVEVADAPNTPGSLFPLQEMHAIAITRPKDDHPLP